MNVSLCKADLKDAVTIHNMKVKSFKPLLEKYQDFETSPANETLERVITQISQSFTDYFIIYHFDVAVGGIRVVKKEDQIYSVSPIFILPEHQGKGIAQKVFTIIEQKYDDAKSWRLGTILQEKGNCYLYEKIGYKKTGVTKVINDKMTMVFYEKHL
ncbi:GNAT family N-acetyltransferase [Paenibacillus illinoisensis]|uniref:GNAT family N-acetyltransferase n=1 Tax=Paenibacillus illinoisensis TaxID=59845 RepID=UPI00203C21C0|nr:GNAT family N-acetyltransferase [Paenibacillus illinoisensis]MCM3203523.1 GNAT family N-acetyltransferase [Paenibacillus illinoisensis]